MSYRIYHGESAEDKEIIGIAKAERGVGEAIKSYLKRNNIVSYYSRRWTIGDNTTIVDYGSHTDFIYIEEV